MCIILFWNAVALEANRISFSNGKMEQPGPTLSSRALAIVHLAMHDAYAAYYPATGPAYMKGLPSAPIPSGASAVLIESLATAAVSASAYYPLVFLYPSQKEMFDRKLSEAGGALNPGHEFGRQVATIIIDKRKNDPTDSAAGYAGGVSRGKHKVDPDTPGQGYHAPYYGALSSVFAVTKRWAIAKPPFDNSDYEAALAFVREKGIRPELMGTLPAGSKPRNENETLMALYWAYDGAYNLGTPPRLYNQIVRRLAIAKENTSAENARLFALVNIAMGDAGILAWEQKYVHNLWRPVVGIRENDPSMGMANEAGNVISPNCDSGWLPLGSPTTNGLTQQGILLQQTPNFQNISATLGGVKNFTPNFPAYPSGHATFGAAALHITRLFYGAEKGGADIGDRSPDHLFDDLDFVSEELNGINQDNRGTVRPRHLRNFPGGLWQMIVENGYSRVFLGVHWLFDAFALDSSGKIDFTNGLDPKQPEITGIGGVPLGLKIAEDIFSSRMTKTSVRKKD